jgi:type I restriction-modification system DNA methylase subunit
MFQLHQDIQFQTPQFVCEYMANLIPVPGSFYNPFGFKENLKILEPTPGIGNLVTAVQNKLPLAQITCPADFFLMDFSARYDLVIMNPPFTAKSADLTHAPADAVKMGMKLGYYILTRCMELTDYVIALMPWFTISDSDIRLKHFVNYGLKAVTPLPRKTFRYARIQTVVIEMERGYTGETIFKTFFHKGI